MIRALSRCRIPGILLLPLLFFAWPGAAQDGADAGDAGTDSLATAVGQAQAADTTRYALMPQGIPSGERLVWREASGLWRHRLTYRGRELLDARTEVDSAGIPVRFRLTGTLPNGLPWEEHFERRGDTVEWSAPGGQGSRMLSGPALYASVAYEAAFELSVLAPFLLARQDSAFPLVRGGEVRLERLGRREVETDGRRRVVDHYAVHGLDLAPEYVWLDESGRLFADPVSIRAGWESVFPELRQASRERLRRHGGDLFGDLIPPPRERPLVIRGARLFEPADRSLRDGVSILIEGDRVAAVEPEGTMAIPDGAEIIDADGRTVVPGLWDMHVHLDEGWVEELEVPLFLAAGVTTVRDLGSPTERLLSLRRRGNSGQALAPRIVPAAITYGPGRRPLGASVGTAEEARDAVDRFAALGYAQVKLYNPVPAELVPVLVERARHHGMRVSGHLPNELTGREAIADGFDEINHLFYARVAAAGIRGLGSDDDVGARMAAVRAGTDAWAEFVGLLIDHGVVIDPTLAVVEETVGGRPPFWLGEVLDRFPERAARMAVHTVGPPAPPPVLRDHWDEIVGNGPGLLRSLFEAGVPLVAGTDAQIGGFELHRELELWVEAGLPAPEVLRMATLGAARTMGMEEELGSIEPGKLADLVLVDGNPTRDIRDIRRVVTVVEEGRVLDPGAIYRALGIDPCCEE